MKQLQKRSHCSIWSMKGKDGVIKEQYLSLVRIKWLKSIFTTFFLVCNSQCAWLTLYAYVILFRLKIILDVTMCYYLAVMCCLKVVLLSRNPLKYLMKSQILITSQSKSSDIIIHFMSWEIYFQTTPCRNFSNFFLYQ